MAKGGVNGFETTVPLVPQWFTGYRSWDVVNVNDQSLLQSVTFPYLWRDGVNEASCLARPKLQDGCRDALHPDSYTHLPECYASDTCAGVTLECGCGFWHYDTPTNWFKGSGGGFRWYTGASSISPGRPWVSGIVHGFGRMVVGTQGFRAGKAVIATLVLPPHVTAAGIPVDAPAGMTAEELTTVRGLEAAVIATQIEEGLRETYPLVPFFRSVESALAAVPLTPMADFMESLKAEVDPNAA